jgi:hypothetical protein
MMDEKNKYKKYKNRVIKKVKCIYKSTKKSINFSSARAAAKFYKISQQMIANHCNHLIKNPYKYRNYTFEWF